VKERYSVEKKKKFISVADQLREEGKIKEIREIAKRMLHLNMDREIIITATGLSEETIKELKKTLE
jgi:predicted transposase/invertase (TIGR01784 family)